MTDQSKPDGLLRCVLISTGGTIASRIDPHTGLAMPVLSANDLLVRQPDLAGSMRIEVEDFVRIPSPHVNPEHWAALYRRIRVLTADDGVSGIVISHGTGLIEETAWFLDIVCDTDKPIIVVGAQRNGSEADYDGARNLRDALRTCVSPSARGRGVMVVMNQHINAAREVSKMHTFDVETFSSGEWGYLGDVSPGGVEFLRGPTRRTHVAYDGQPLARVEIASMYAGATGSAIAAAVADGARGIVVQAVGSGHVNPEMARAVADALGKGVAVVVATRVPRGGTRACYGFEGSSQRLEDAGAVLAGRLSAWKARVLLMVALSSGVTSTADLRSLFR